MENASIGKLLLRLSPPVMLALLIQSIYNIVDSYYVARYLGAGLTALSIIFPVQLLMTAVATGTGASVGILISRMDSSGDDDSQGQIIKNRMLLGVFNYLVFLVLRLGLIRWYFILSSDQTDVREQGICYATIILIGSFGQFADGISTKILQAKGNMVIPMIA